MKRFLAITLVIILALTLLTACPFGGDTPDGGTSGRDDTLAAPETTPTPPTTEPPKPTTNDPCPCCPDCIQEECSCEECVNSDDCKCSAPGGSEGPFTFLVEIDTNIIGSLGQGYRTIGTATITLDDFDSSGWFGSAVGAGIYTDISFEYLEYQDYTFNVKLSNYDPQIGDSIMIGADTFSHEDCYLMMSFEVHRTDLFDFDTWLYIFELPMENGVAKLIDHWKEPPPGLIVIDMTITVTLVD